MKSQNRQTYIIVNHDQPVHMQQLYMDLVDLEQPHYWEKTQLFSHHQNGRSDKWRAGWQRSQVQAKHC